MEISSELIGKIISLIFGILIFYFAFKRGKAEAEGKVKKQKPIFLGLNKKELILLGIFFGAIIIAIIVIILFSK